MATSRDTWRGEAFLLRVDQKRIGVPLNRRVKIELAKNMPQRLRQEHPAKGLGRDALSGLRQLQGQRQDSSIPGTGSGISGEADGQR